MKGFHTVMHKHLYIYIHSKRTYMLVIFVAHGYNALLQFRPKSIDMRKIFICSQIFISRLSNVSHLFHQLFAIY